MNKPYCLIYRRFSFPDVELYFDREIDMEGHVNIWIDGDVDYIHFYLWSVEYTPTWWAE